MRGLSGRVLSCRFEGCLPQIQGHEELFRGAFLRHIAGAATLCRCVSSPHLFDATIQERVGFENSACPPSEEIVAVNAAIHAVFVCVVTYLLT